MKTKRPRKFFVRRFLSFRQNLGHSLSARFRASSRNGEPEASGDLGIRRFSLEPLEPRLLLSADLSYLSGPGAVWLQAGLNGTQPTLNLVSITSGQSTVLASDPLSAGLGHASVQVEGGQTLHVDLTTFNLLDQGTNATSSNAFTLSIVTDPLALTPGKIFLDGGTSAAPAVMNFSLNVTADSPFTVDGSTTIANTGSLSAGNSLSLTSSSSTSGLASTGIEANATTGITLNGAAIVASGTVSVNAISTVTVNDSGPVFQGATLTSPGAVITSNSSATVNIENGTSIDAASIQVGSSVIDNLTASVENWQFKAIVVDGSASSSVNIDGLSQLTATGADSGTGSALNVNASTNVSISAVAQPGVLGSVASATSNMPDAAAVTTTFADSSTVAVTGGAVLDASNASGSASLLASDTLNATNTADSSVSQTAGASLAVSVFSGDTSAYVSGATVNGANGVNVAADTSRTIATTALSSPGGGNPGNILADPASAALAQYQAQTSSGSINVAGAIAISTDSGSTTAYIDNASIDAGSSAASVIAASSDNVAVSANGTSTSANAVGVGVAVAIDDTVRSDLAYLSGSDIINAGTLNVLVSQLNGVASSFGASAISGSGSASEASIAGALAMNVTVFDHQAYIDANATVTLTGSPQVTISADDNVTSIAISTPSAGSDPSASNFGLGASVAYGYNQDTTEAYIANGAALSGANNLSLSATSVHQLTASATAGGSGGVAITPVVAIAISDDTTYANLGTGAAISIQGTFTATSSLNNQVATSATGTTNGGSAAVGIAVSLAIVNDSSEATTARDLIAATGAVSFLSSSISRSQSTSSASAAGGPASGSSGGSQSVDQQTASQQSFADTAASSQANDTKAGTTTQGSEGATTSGAQTSDGSVSVAGAVAVDVENSQSKAFIPTAVSVASGGLLTLASASNVDGHAVASGVASTNPNGAGVGVAVSVNFATNVDLAYIDAGSTISAGGLFINAGMAQLPTPFDVVIEPVVWATPTDIINQITNAGTAYLTGTFDPTVYSEYDTLFLGAGTNLQTGQAVVYSANGSSPIAGLVDQMVYYVNVQSDGRIALYYTQAAAQTGGWSPERVFFGGPTSGLGTDQIFYRSFSPTDVLTASSIDSLIAIHFNPQGSVDLLGISSGSFFSTGNAVTYSANGGPVAGGLTDGTAYNLIQVSAGSPAVDYRFRRDRPINLTVDGGNPLYQIAGSAHNATAGTAIAIAAPTSATTGVSNWANWGPAISNPLASTNPDSLKATNPDSVTLSAPTGMSGAAFAQLISVTAGTGTIVASNNSVTLTSTAADTVFTFSGVNSVAVDSGNSGEIVLVGSFGQQLIDQTNSYLAQATSGAGGGAIGVAGAVAVNIVSNDVEAQISRPEASIAPATIIVTGSGDISVTATNNVENSSIALPNGEGGGGDKAGVGASSAVNVLTNTAVAQLSDGTVLSGTIGAFTMDASLNAYAMTQAQNGAAGGGVSAGIGVAVLIASDTASSYVGTGSGISATGSISVTSALNAEFATTTSADAAGSTAAVGASVSVALETEISKVVIARDLGSSGAGSTFVASSLESLAISTIATASASGTSSTDGEAKSNANPSKTGADGQADHAVADNPNTRAAGASMPVPSASSTTTSESGKSTSKGGGSSGGVGIAASVAYNALNETNTVSISNGASVHVLGAVSIRANALLSATVTAVGSAIAVAAAGSGSQKVSIGAGVALNVVNATNSATVGAGSTISGDGISILADIPLDQNGNPQANQIVAWGASAGGNTGSAAVAGSVAVNDITGFVTQASAAAGSTLNSSGSLTVTAKNNINIQTVAAAGAFSKGAAVGASVAVAVAPVTTTAFIDGNASASGAVAVSAATVLVPAIVPLPFISPSADPTATSVAVAGAVSSGQAGVAGSVIVNDFTLQAIAAIGNSATIQADSLSVTALNTTEITAIAGALGLTSGAAGVGASLDLELIAKTTTATIGTNADVTITNAATVAATSSDTMLSFVATVGGGDSVGIAGTASIASIVTDTEATVGNNTILLAGGAVDIAANNTFKTTLLAGAVGLSASAGIGAANATLLHTATTTASVGASDQVTAAYGLTVSALASEDILSIVAGIGVGGDVGVAGSAVVNVLTEHTTASVGHGSTITVSAGSLGVTAEDDTSVIAVAGDLAASGSASVGVGVDVGTYSKHTNAYIGSGVVATVSGDVAVQAIASESILSVAAGIAAGDVAVGVNAGVHTFDLQTRAFIGDDPNAPTNSGAGDVHAHGNVIVRANDVTNLNEIVGVLAAGSVGVAAGAGVTVSQKDTEAFIGVGANVTADGVGAGGTVYTGAIGTGLNTSAATFDPGSPSGVGIDSSNANTLTAAESGNRSSLQSQGQVGTPQLSGMDLTGNGSSQSVNNSSLQGQRTTSPTTIGSFHGVAVTATNQDELRSFTVSFGAGSVGIGLSAGVVDVKATTLAYVAANATVNTDNSALPGQAQSVLIGAGNDFYHLSVGVGVGVGSVGIAPSIGVNLVSDTTEATIGSGATVKASGDISVAATANENIAVVGIGVAAGSVGIGGVVDLLQVTDTTIASIGDGAIVSDGGNVFVGANDNTSILVISGALAGGEVGIGGAAGVILLNKTTDATIGVNAHVDALGNTNALSGVLDGNLSGSGFETTSANGVILQALSNETIQHIVAAGGVGYVGVSGAVGVALINGSTEAQIGAGAQIDTANPGAAGGTQSVYVNAANSVTIDSYVIGVAGGFVGVSGAVDVGTLNNNIDAVIASGAVVRAADNIGVNAVGQKSLTGYVISGAGGAVGVGASVSVWSVGSPLVSSYSDNNANSANATSNSKGSADTNAASQANTGSGLVTGGSGIGSLTTAGANSNGSAGQINTATQGASSSVNSATPSAGSIVATETAASLPSGTTADVYSGATLSAGNNIAVQANDAVTVDQILGQVAAGVVGAGAAVNIFTIADNVTAHDDGTNNAGNTLTVSAQLTSSQSFTSLDLAAGFVGVGAGVVVVVDDSSTTATLGNVSSAGAVYLSADSSRTISTLAGQASIGAVGVGATFTEVTIGGSTTATVDANAQIGSVTAVGSLDVVANASISTNVDTYAVAAGIGAATANFSFVTVDPSLLVSASLGDGVTVDASGAVTVSAGAVTDLQAQTFGVAAGGLAVGASLTDISFSPTIVASVGTSDTIVASALAVTAQTSLPSSGYSAQAKATGSAGALVGLTSTNAIISNTAVVKAFVAASAQIAVVGSVSIVAADRSRQKASADSNAAGLYAAGIAYADVTSGSTTLATIGNSAHVTAGSLTVGATGSDDDFAYTNAGSGGEFAVAAAVANTTNTSSTTASIGSGAVVTLTGALNIAADHVATFNSQITSLAGGVLAGTGGNIVNNVTTDTTASVGANASITADTIAVTANNDLQKPALTGSTTQNIMGTTGGLVSAAGASDTSTLSVTTLVTIGDGASLVSMGGGVTSNNPDLVLTADNNFNVVDVVTFETGGALSGAGVNASIDVVTDLAKISIGTGSSLWTNGSFVATARGQGLIQEDITTDTYGAATVATGTSSVNLSPTNQVDFGANSQVTAYGDLTVGVGTDSASNYDAYKVAARFDGTAGSVVPISAVNATAQLTQYNTIDIATGAQLSTARQANLDAQQLSIADMTGYAQIDSWTNSASSFLTGTTDHSGSSQSQTYATVIDNGTVATGLTRTVTLTFQNNPNATSAANSVIATQASTGVTFSVGTQQVASNLVNELNYDQAQMNQFGSSNATLYNFYANDAASVQATLLAEGLGEMQGSVFVPIQAQVDTITVNPIYADAGLIDIRATDLQGSGTFFAPSNASVTIINNSIAYLNIEGIAIPANNGGLYFNGVRETTNAQIAQLNAYEANYDNSTFNYSPQVTVGSAAFDLTNVAGGAAATPPSVTISNTLDMGQFNATQASAGLSSLPWPNITIEGTGISNINGSVTISQAAGSTGAINQNAPIQAANISETTSGAVTVFAPSTAVAGTPYATAPAGQMTWNDATTGVYYTAPTGQQQTSPGVAAASGTAVQTILAEQPTAPALSGSSIIINCNFIDLNGIIQSGQSNYTLTLGTQASSDIQALINAGATGTQFLQNESNSNFQVYFNMSTGQIMVDPVKISGGFVSLTGHILNTGNGAVDVLGGYANIDVTNNTNYSIAVNNLDNSSMGKGQLIINDTSKATTGSGGSVISAQTTTTYADTGSGMTVTTDPGVSGVAPVVQNVGSLNSTYDPAAGWRYGWTYSYGTQYVATHTESSSNWLGVVPTGSSSGWTLNGTPTSIPSVSPNQGAYYFYAPGNTAAYDFSSNTVVTADSGWQETSSSKSTTWYGKTTYTENYQDVYGTQTYDTSTIGASRAIGINFFGSASGSVTVQSTGSGDVYLNGNILNPSGQTTIVSGGAILSNTLNEQTTGSSVLLQAATGIGSVAIPIQVVVKSAVAGGSASFTATTTNGNIVVSQISGTMPLNLVQSVSQGSVTLRSAGGIVATGPHNGLVEGGIISLTADGGSIGSSTSAPILLSTPNPVPGLTDSVTVTAQQNVYLQETTGDLRLYSLTAGGTAWIDVPNGSLLNANTAFTTDTRTEAQLSSTVWTYLGLTAGTGYQQKVDNTLSSYVGQQNAAYNLYWQYRAMQPNGGTSYDPTFVVSLSAAETTAYTSYYQGLGYTQSQIANILQTLVNSRTAQYRLLNATFGVGGTYAAQDSNFNPDVQQVLGAQTSVAAYFTADGSGGGTISLASGQSWASNGFSAGQTIQIAGSASNSTVGGTFYTIAAVNGNVLTLSNTVGTATTAAALASEGSAGQLETITVEHQFNYLMTANEKSTLIGGIKEWTPAQLMSLFSAGLMKNVTSTVVTTTAPNIVATDTTILTQGSVGQSGTTTTISVAQVLATGFTQQQQAILAAAERTDVQYIDGSIVTATVNFATASGGGTITRTDGGNWNSFAVGDYLTIGSAGNQATQNATTGTVFDRIVSISGNVLTISGNTLVPELGMTVTAANVVLDPTFQATAAAQSVGVYFVPNTAFANGQIVRADGGSWLTDGYQVGQLLQIAGSLKNNTQQGQTYTIDAVTASTLTLSSSNLVTAEGSGVAPVSVAITRGMSPTISLITVAQQTAVFANVSGVLNVTAGSNVFLDSSTTLQIDQVLAGDAVTGAPIRIKGQGSILNGGSASTVNLRGGTTILEAGAGSIGSVTGTGLALNFQPVGNATITLRALNVIDVNALAGGSGTLLGNLKLESAYSATGDVILSAAGSVINALDTPFAQISAYNVVLNATSGTVGNIVAGGINSIQVDASGSVSASAYGNIWINGTDGNLPVGVITSATGDVILQATQSILAAASDSLLAPAIEGNSITLTALTDAIGSVTQALNIVDRYSSGSGVVTASANLGGIYLTDTLGNLYLNEATAGANSVIGLTALTGSILNSAVAGVEYNVVGNAAALVANQDVGASAAHIITKVATLQDQSTAGSTWVDNIGALTIGGIGGSAYSVQAGAGALITASSPITVSTAMLVKGDLTLIAQNSNVDGYGNIVIDGSSTQGGPLLMQISGTANILAGANLTIQSGATIEAGAALYLKSDYQGDLLGNPIAGPTIFAATGTSILIGGVVAAPTVTVAGGDGPGTIVEASTGLIMGGFPWTVATYPVQFGSMPSTPPSASQVIISGSGGANTVQLSGAISAVVTQLFGGNINDNISVGSPATGGELIVYGGAGSSTIDVGAANAIIFANYGAATFSGTALVSVQTTNPSSGSGNVITVGSGNDIIFGGAGSNVITAGSGNDIIFGNYGSVAFNPDGSLSSVISGDVVTSGGTTVAFGASNTILAGAGNDIVFGGVGTNKIVAGNGADIVIGHEGAIAYDASGLLVSIQSSNPGYGGANVIALGSGADVVVGGMGSQNIAVGSGNDIVLGHNGTVAYAGGVLTGVQATDPVYGGNVAISAGSGNDVILAGSGSDTIVAGSGNDAVFGGDGIVTWTGSVLTSLQTTDAGSDGTNVIDLGSGKDVVFGEGSGSVVGSVVVVGTANQITVAAGNDIVLGNYGTVTFSGSGVVSSIASGDVVTSGGTTSVFGSGNVIVAGAGNDTLIGGVGSNTIVAGSGSDVVIGHEGAVAFDISGRLVTVQNTDLAYGGSSAISLGSGADVVVGGTGSQNIVLGSGNDIVLGHNGTVSYAGGVINSIVANAPSYGGAATIEAGAGNDTIIGGVGTNTIVAGSGADVVIGHDGTISYDPQGRLLSIQSTDLTDGGTNTITLGSGQNVVLGGFGTQSISVGSGKDVILGHNGTVVYAGGILTSVAAAAPTPDGAAVIAAGSGNDTIIGGVGANTIVAGNGADIVIGHDGTVTFDANGLLLSIQSTDVGDGGANVINLGSGNDVVLGGAGSQYIAVGSGNDVILGHNGALSYMGGVLTVIGSNAPDYGGTAVIAAGAGNDTIIGGVGANTITAGSGADIVIGHDGTILYDTQGRLVSIQSTDLTYGGANVITLGSGRDIVLGSLGSQNISVGSGNDIVLGHNGVLNYVGGALTSIASTSPTSDGAAVITAGSGNYTIIGGAGTNTIVAGSGTDVVIGQDGSIAYDSLGRLLSIQSTDVSYGSSDVIALGSGRDIVVGGTGTQNITVGAGNDIVIGHNGSLNYSGGLLASIATATPNSAGVAVVVAGSGNDTIIGGAGINTIVAGSGADIVLGQDGTISYDVLGRLVSIASANITYGGSSVITLGSGQDVLVGGTGSQNINVGSGNDIVLGHNGTVAYSGGVLTSVQADSPAYGGNAVIFAGSGNDVILAGSGSDTIAAGSGNDIVFGGDGIVTWTGHVVTGLQTTDAGFDGANAITLGSGKDVVFGEGSGSAIGSTVTAGTANRIAVASGNDIVLGNYGTVTFNGSGAVSSIASGDVVTSAGTTSVFGSGNTIVAGSGNDTLIGGVGSNTIVAGSGMDIVIGHEGAIAYDIYGRLVTIQSTDVSYGGSNAITLGSGADVVFGGTGSQAIVLGSGRDIVVGHNGTVAYAGGVLTSVEANSPAYGGNVVISAGSGNDVILAGSGSDTIVAGSGADVVFGGDGIVTWTGYFVTGLQTTDAGSDGANTITLGSGKDVVFGEGSGSAIGSTVAAGTPNRITVASGNDIVLGNYGTVTFNRYGTASSIVSGDVVTSGGTTSVFGSGNIIVAGSGNDTLIGGVGSNTIVAGSGMDIVIGHEGAIAYDIYGRLVTIQSTDVSYGGSNVITLGSGRDIVIGGAGPQSITVGSGNDIAIADNAVIDYTNGIISSIRSSPPTPGITSSISFGFGSDLIIANVGVDTISPVRFNTVVLTDGSSLSPPAWTAVKWQLAAAPAPVAGQSAAVLTESQLAVVVAEAEAIWRQALGAGAPQLAALDRVIVAIGQLPSGTLGSTRGSLITIDATAAGWGWFVDTGAATSANFAPTAISGVMVAIPGSGAAGHMDLLSTVLHELGNAMGFAEDYGQDVAGAVLSAGMRRLPLSLTQLPVFVVLTAPTDNLLGMPLVGSSIGTPGTIPPTSSAGQGVVLTPAILAGGSPVETQQATSLAMRTVSQPGTSVPTVDILYGSNGGGANYGPGVSVSATGIAGLRTSTAFGGSPIDTSNPISSNAATGYEAYPGDTSAFADADTGTSDGALPEIAWNRTTVATASSMTGQSQTADWLGAFLNDVPQSQNARAANLGIRVSLR